MPGTKIINVLRDDKLEDVLDVFRSASATEVIFVLPKRSKAFSSEGSFAVISDESQELGKNVLILSDNPEVRAHALKYSLGVLAGEEEEDEQEEELEEKIEDAEEESEEVPEETEETEESAPVEYPAEIKIEEPEAMPVNYDEDEEEPQDHEEEIPDQSDTPDDGPSFQENKIEDVNYFSRQGEATLAYARLKSPKNMKDVVVQDEESSVSLKVNKRSERPAKVNLKAETRSQYGELERNAISEIQNVWQKRDIPKKAPQSSKSFLTPKSFSLRPLFRSYRGYFYGMIIAAVLIFGGVLYVSMGKAEVIIRPRSNTIGFSLKVSSSDSYLEVDASLKRIPGQVFNIEKTVTETYSATGEKDVVQKARGKITVYNEYGTTPQTLIATTRFETDKGLIFRTLKNITIPGTTVKNGQITPGQVDVEVIADKAGDAYNIGPGKFYVSAFREKGDNDRYQKFYGISTEPIKGGIVGKAKVVTEKDYTDAKNDITEKVLKATEEDIRAKASGLKVLNLSAPAIKEIIPSANIDEAVDTFTVKGTADISTVGFRQSDLDDLISSYIKSNNDVEVLPEKLDLKFDDVKFDPLAGALEFTVNVSGTIYNKINQEKIITDLMGKGEEDIKEYVKSADGIYSARVKLSPFWVWKVPKDKDKIQVKLEYN